MAYWLKASIKQDHVRRWALPDRIFFGYGACHILAGTYIGLAPLDNFHAERIVPRCDKPGGHMYVTNGVLAFDFHGYSLRDSLLTHHYRTWRQRDSDWAFDTEIVDFPILAAGALNGRKMLGPDQYLHDAMQRAEAFIRRIDHPAAASRAAARLN